ncbi:hypothetical protein NE237_028646 [Protea cynaroides]|uniref:NOT2/NOT3/NOT5 C-terminal domain-containing protein n=1 Tax=Protea cynaroides TaxID=273540 RepID=A0A9Q0JT31_9MAGN|nr:hypothetical protein NE237_028646 [Protea cynaroides]
MHGSNLFPSSHENYHPQAQNSGLPNIGLRPVNSPNSVSGMGSYDQFIQQYQISRASLSFNCHKVSNPNLNSLALGTDLITLGSLLPPWSAEPEKGEHVYTVPESRLLFKIQPETLFYIFYSLLKDEAQLPKGKIKINGTTPFLDLTISCLIFSQANRGWFYHRELRLWLIRVSNMEPLVKTNTYERGSYLCFDPNTWETVRKDNFVLHYKMLEKRSMLLQH